VRVVPDPIRGAPHLLIMTEVLNPDGTPHETNTRAPLAALINDKVRAEAPLFGFEQEYTMLKPNSTAVVGWPEGGYPAPQGPFYCGVGVNSVFGRPLAEAHMEACLGAGITISGINAEVMPGQWCVDLGGA
jgi:glutamine synthetase